MLHTTRLSTVRRTRFVLACAALLAAAAAPAVADACSPPFCNFGTQIPGDMSIVPANLPGIFWLTDDGVAATPESVRLYRVSDSQEVPLELTSLGGGLHDIKLLEQLAPDQAHALVLGSECIGTGLADDTAPVFELMTAAASPLPDALGDLVASGLMHGPLELATTNGGCSEPVESAYVDVTLELAPAAVPWRDVLVFETWVDGQPWSPSDFLPLPPPPGESWLGRGVDRVYATCAPGDVVDPGLSEGKHKVVIRARIPGGDVVLASPPIDVQLTCSDVGTSSSGGESSTGDTSTSSGGDTSGGGVTSTSEGNVTGTGDTTGPGGLTDASTAASDASAGGTSGPPHEVGCACHAGGDASPFGPALASALLLALTRPRPRRGPRPPL